MSWPITLLGDVVDVLDSQRRPITKSDRRFGPYPYYGATGVVDWVDGYLFDEPLVLIGEDGAKWGAGDQSAFSIEGKAWVNNHAHVLRPHRSDLLDDWLIYFLNAADLSEYVSGMTVPKLNQGNLRQIEVPLPPLAEQKRIVAKLDQAFAALDRARANAEANLEDAERLALCAVSEVLQGPKTQDWDEITLNDLAVVDWGNTNLTKSSYVEGGSHLAVSAAGCDGRIGHAEHKKHTPVLSAIGARCGRMFLPEEDFTAIKNTITLTPRGGKCDPFFLYYLMGSIELPQRGAGQPFISKGDIQRFAVRIPKIEEQRDIAAVLTELTDRSKRIDDQLRGKLTNIAELRQSLIQAAFSGQLT